MILIKAMKHDAYLHWLAGGEGYLKAFEVVTLDPVKVYLDSPFMTFLLITMVLNGLPEDSPIPFINFLKKVSVVSVDAIYKDDFNQVNHKLEDFYFFRIYF